MCNTCNTISGPCGCNNFKTGFGCVIYDGCSLTPLTIVRGDNLEEVTEKINELFKKVFTDIDNAFVAKSVGSGIDIYIGQNENDTEEFRSLNGINGIKSELSEDGTINLYIDEKWIQEYYPNFNLRSIGTGLPIVERSSLTDFDFAINTLSSDDESLRITKRTQGGINIESNVKIDPVGVGVSLIKQEGNDTKVKTISSSNDSVHVTEKQDGGIDLQVNPDAVKASSYYKIILSNTAVSLSSNGVFKPTSVSAKVIRSSNTEIAETTEGKLYYRFDFQSGIGTQIGFNEALVLSNTGDPKYIDFIYYPPGATTVADLQTVSIVREGKPGEPGNSPYVLDLTNDNASVSALYDGTVVDTSTANTKYALYKDNDLVTTGVTYTHEPLNPNGITYTVDAINRVIQVTGMTSDTNGVFVTARINNETVASSTFSVSKVKGGKPGEAGTIVYLSISNAVVTVDKQNILVPDILYATAYSKKGTEAPVEITTGVNIKYKVVNKDSEGPLTDYVFGQPIALGGLVTENARFIKFYLYDSSNNILDSEDIPILRNGKDGIYTEQRFQKNASFTLPPAVDKNAVIPAGWSLQPEALGGTEIQWSIFAVKEVGTGNLVSPWSDAIRISGPMGPKGEDGAASSTFIAPMGEWKDNKQYQGNPQRIEAVKYNGKWYVSRADAGLIPTGTPPTNTQYWNASNVNYDFIATGLFLAETAWIDNLGVSNLKTSIPEYCPGTSKLKTNPKRIEINSSTNSIEFFSGEETFTPCDIDPQPTIKIDAIPGFNSVEGAQNVGTIYMRGKKGSSNVITSVSTDGIIANGGNTSFLPGSSGVNTSTSVAGLNAGKPGEPGIFNNNAYHVGVAGTNNTDDSYGINFGGYFDKAFIGGHYHRLKIVDATGGNTALSRFDNVAVAYTTGNSSVTLPFMTTLNDGWHEGVGFTLVIINLNANTLTINAASGNEISVASGNGSTRVTSASITNRGKATMIWTGQSWVSI